MYSDQLNQSVHRPILWELNLSETKGIQEEKLEDIKFHRFECKYKKFTESYIELSNRLDGLINEFTSLNIGNKLLSFYSLFEKR